MTETTSSTGITSAQGIHHVRLTVTDIARSKAFYTQLLGMEPAMDFTEQSGDSEAVQDPQRLYAGCVFSFGDQLLGLRPAARSGDTFDSTRVGLDHVSLALGSVDDLTQAAQRLDAAGIENGGVHDLGDMGMAIVSVQDPDDINLELVAAT